jgi:phage-related protein
MYREIVFYGNHFEDFFAKQSLKVQKKIVAVLDLITVLERVPVDYLKHLEGTEGLYEIRVQFASDAFRLFCFFDEGKLVVVLNGFQKKSQKTPRGELERALRLRDDYFSEKRNTSVNKRP